jgi:hypothetical protein
MIKHKFQVTVNNKVIFSTEDTTYTAFREVQKEMDKILWSQWRQGIGAANSVVGQKGSVDMGVVSWECTMNGRAPRRPPHIIAAEKAARAAKGQQRKERREQWKREAAERVVHLRNRIKHQVDHAFATGKSGTEPASKYITCQHCDGPAALVCLSRLPTKGASVLDEDTIVGALCSNHSNYNGNQPKIPCAKLEFFYDGIRQIAIKP